MPYKCAAFGCRTGYSNGASGCENQPVSLFRFPTNDPECLKLWCRRLSRENFTPNKSSRLCSLHFVEADFEIDRKDANRHRAVHLTPKLSQRRLKPNAVPSVFPNMPSYFSCVPDISRPGETITAKFQHIEELFSLESCKPIKLAHKLSLKSLHPNDDSMKIFCQQISRGGLVSPTALAFAVCLKCWHCFATIKMSPCLKTTFLSLENHKRGFQKIISVQVQGDDDLTELLIGRTHCESGHQILEHLAERFFNCLVKNFAKELTTECNNLYNVRKGKRKIDKMLSRF